MVLDFGPGSVDGWLTRLVALELGVDAGPRLDSARRELQLNGRAVALTQLECELLGYLQERAGQADPEVAADLTAETFVAALASAHRFRPRRKPAVAWLFGIARNNLAMSHRQGRVDARARRRLGMAPLVFEGRGLRVADLNDATAPGATRHYRGGELQTDCPRFDRHPSIGEADDLVGPGRVTV